MTKKTAAKTSKLADLNIAPGCRVFKSTWNFERPTRKFMAETLYTPRHIQKVIEGQGEISYWVKSAGGWELWKEGDELATRL